MDLKPYWKFAWTVVVLAVALLSGVISVIRELIAIVFGKPAAPSVYWSWLWVAFVLSAAILYAREYTGRLELEKKLRSRNEEQERQKQLRSNFADLMQEGKSLEEAIITTPNPNTVNNELIHRWKDWNKRVFSALNDADWKTEAVAFSHSSENPSSNELGSYVHIPETKRLYVVQLRMERRKLEAIVERKLP